MKKRLLVCYLACALAAGSGPGISHAQRSREPVTLNFVNADIEAVARTMAAITGRNIVVDPRVKGTINLSTDRPVSPTVAYNQFLAAIRLSGFTMVESGGLLKLVPEADAKLQGGAVSAGAPVAGNQIVTQIFRLNYEPAGNLVPILRPLISPNNTINVNPGNNSLVITDYADNLQRIARIIAALDVSNATDVEVIPLRNALASDLAPVVQRLVDSSGPTGAPAAAGQGQADTSFRTTVIPEVRSNTLLVRAANPARLNLVRSLVEKLDQPGSQSPTGNIYVVYLKNAEAAKLAITLRAAMAATTTGAAAGGAAPSAQPAPPTAQPTAAGASPATAPTQPSAQPSTGGQIQADPATNSLIITAAEPQYRQIRAVIDRLDARRAQVYVESLIAEVNADKAAEFGIQWQGPLGNKGDKNVGVLGTNFTIGGQNIITLATQAESGNALPSSGLNFGVARQFGGVYVLNFLARFLEANGHGNILSTPNLLTLDNEEAKIVIGQNVPFVTGQFTNTGASNGSVNPFQTIERKDVGLTLRVKPQISENGTVKLQIFQEVSSVQASSINSATGLITNKRSIESNILVDDGSIVVLGGLLQDEYSGNQEKVPILGDVPIIGNLFKSETRSRKKTNLMVFLRPVVVRDAVQSDVLSLDRYDLMRGKQEAAQPRNSLVVPVNEAPVLPPLRPPEPPAVPVPVPPVPLGQ
ncbi:type II secretion system secretin GspD [Caenimonas soli]|uniref:type II secretion system secretin GspD n=1 Tax=Caenimonas soli TaxID=2735555 RepID=UPI0015547F2B|nr:type II secretion system secretin GspD [Caenimonas soli]NPC57972.1 type II secretion system secretin GspD [Caenimonas soli]